jgi:hypothetical protein
MKLKKVVQRAVAVALVITLDCLFAWSQLCDPHWYSRTSGNPKWQNGTLTYRINDNMQIPGLGQVVWENAIVAAHQAWNNSNSAFQFVRGANTSNNYTETGNDNQNVYGWVIDSMLPAGRTRARYLPSTGYFTEIDAYFNQHSRYQWSTNPSGTQLDIQSVAVHELGHWLGLDDEIIQVSGITCPASLTCPTNVMWNSYVSGTTRRVLTNDDRFGAQSIYPVSRSNTTISTNMTKWERWSGNITLTNDPHITCGVTVVMTGGTLIIPSGRRLYVDDHATLTLNAGVIRQALGAHRVAQQHRALSRQRQLELPAWLAEPTPADNSTRNTAGDIRRGAEQSRGCDRMESEHAQYVEQFTVCSFVWKIPARAVLGWKHN